MRILAKNIFILIAAGLASCTSQTTDKQVRQARAQVRTTIVEQGYLPDYLVFSGKTIYLNNNNIVAPISGYITKLNVKPADKVKKGDELFLMQSRESYALNNSSPNASGYGGIKIKAPADGVINRLVIFRSPVYVDAGSTLCNIVETGSLYASVEIPYEYVSYARQGNKCKIILPDNTICYATFSKVLSRMNEGSQTLNVLAIINTDKIIPEGMIVEVVLEKGIPAKSQLLDKKCVISDALMKNLWVMKLINDSTAVRVDVKVGRQNHEKVEILSPVFNTSDKIISQGAYGLDGTALVEVIN
ncbi:MAG: HlyD family efflux transporter periplasmic adaptor subunit [Chlorobi bacterium]|nr:HlyD family efflux transporter periplasmic adaptor subunit [Chlorobiota bacterium]